MPSKPMAPIAPGRRAQPAPAPGSLIDANRAFRALQEATGIHMNVLQRAGVKHTDTAANAIEIVKRKVGPEAWERAALAANILAAANVLRAAMSGDRPPAPAARHATVQPSRYAWRAAAGLTAADDLAIEQEDPPAPPAPAPSPKDAQRERVIALSMADTGKPRADVAAAYDQAFRGRAPEAPRKPAPASPAPAAAFTEAEIKALEDHPVVLRIHRNVYHAQSRAELARSYAAAFPAQAREWLSAR